MWRGRWGDPVPLFGPLPGMRDGHAVAYEFELPPAFIPRAGMTLLERIFVLTDVGASMVQPAWRGFCPDGADSTGLCVDSHMGAGDPISWYVDLVHVTDDGDSLIFRDLYLDVMVPTDGRHLRHLDLDELAEAIESDTVPVDVAADGLRRWQAFLDRHLHDTRGPRPGYPDFPPTAFERLAALPAPLGPPVHFTLPLG